MKLFLTCLTVLTSVFSLFADGSSSDDKLCDIAFLNNSLNEAKGRVMDSSLTKAGDFLQILPTVSVSKSSPISNTRKGETYLSISFSANQIGGISDKRSNRDELRRKAIRQIESIGYELRKLIDRKNLLKERLWKFSKIRGSLSNPVDIASIDEKIDEVKIKIQEIEISIEKGYAEIEFICVGVEG